MKIESKEIQTYTKRRNPCSNKREIESMGSLLLIHDDIIILTVKESWSKVKFGLSKFQPIFKKIFLIQNLTNFELEISLLLDYQWTSKSQNICLKKRMMEVN